MLDWSTALEIGHPVVDAQHRGIVERLNALHQAMLRGELEETPRLLEYLTTYVAEHFSTEERLMREADYPGLAEHRAQHERFVREYAEMAATLREKGATVSLTLRVKSWLGDWVRDHVATTDMAMGRWLFERRALE